MELLKLQCEKCGHGWVPRVENPVKCPKCGHLRDASIRTRKAKEAKLPHSASGASNDSTSERRTNK